jgi:hypothetical protein
MGWLDLAADYFEPVAREVFDGHMQRYGFGHGEADETGALIFRRAGEWWPRWHRYDRLLEIGYVVEDSPNYSPVVAIGLAPRWAAGPNRIALHHCIPQDRSESEYPLWRFSNAEQLRQILTRIREGVVDRYARPLWEDPKSLAVEVARVTAWARTKRQNEIRMELLRRAKEEAEHAFRSRDYGKAVALYDAMADSDLSKVERKRRELARKYASR